MTPRSRSSITPMPLQPPANMALITTTPGVRKVMYELVVKPGISTIFLNRAPNNSSQVAGSAKVRATYQGWRRKLRNWRTVR